MTRHTRRYRNIHVVVFVVVAAAVVVVVLLLLFVKIIETHNRSTWRVVSFEILSYR